MKKLATLVLGLLIAGIAQAQYISSTSEVYASHTYMLKNANGYGFCVYDPYRGGDGNFLTLAGATVDHQAGCANERYRDVIDATNTNAHWKFVKQSPGVWALKNVGQNKYATNTLNGEDSFAWYLSDEPVGMKLTDLGNGMFAIRYSNTWDSKRFMCAAGHTEPPIVSYLSDDMGSQWMLLDLSSTNLVRAKNISMEAAAIAIEPGKTRTLQATITPENVTFEGIKWTSSNSKIATVDNNGTVTALALGQTTITAMTTDGTKLSAQCKVIVAKNTVVVEEEEEVGTLRYLTFHDGQMVAIPEKYILKEEEAGGRVTLTLDGDTTFTYTVSHLASKDTVWYGSKPEFESFKFNNKFNDQLYVDVDGEIDPASHSINLQVPCIGKRLVPSFKVPDGASVWVNGIRQQSKKTSQRWDNDILYTVAYPKSWVYEKRKISDAIYSNPDDVDTESEWLSAPVNLTADMLSTNAPSNYEEMNLEKLVDDNTGTWFQSTWGSGAYEKLTWYEGATYGDGTSEWPYVQINLPEPIYNLKMAYTVRDLADYAPLGFIIQASEDGKKWFDAAQFTQERDNLPTEAGASYTTPFISLGKACSMLRFQLTAAAHKNYISLAEMSILEQVKNPDYGKAPQDAELLIPAVYARGFYPFGTDYKVHAEFLTDQSTSEYQVPTIRINTFDGSMITSKTRYWDASFTLEGAGIWPDIQIDTMQIRGRGNSSWGGGWSKEPYRLKFAEKIKPFGLTKGKSWVLLANKQSGSLTTNAIAMKIADMVESKGCNHIVPVELYVNGEYRGSYNFTEKTGISNNSINLDDETNAAMVELDSYYDEVYKFRTDRFSVPVNIKFPDFTDPTEVTNLNSWDIQNSINTFVNSVYETNQKHSQEAPVLLDVDAFCRAMLVNDLVNNTELQHPKSWNVYNPDVLNDSAWYFGPVWDFDWSYGYEGTGTYFINDAESDVMRYTSNTGTQFFAALLRGSEEVKKHYYRVWTEFIRDGKVDELVEYCDDYFAFANASFKHNATKWGDGNSYAGVTTNSKNWLTKRANWIYKSLTKYDLGDDIIPDEPEEYGKPDRVDLTKLMSQEVDVYTLHGIRIRKSVPANTALDELMPGIYIVNGHKITVR